MKWRGEPHEEITCIQSSQV